MSIGIGTKIRDYNIVAKLGEGGMGTVWQATDENLGRTVALKVLAPQLANDESFVERFKQEARVQAQLVHSGIVALHNFFFEGSTFVMVLEYAPGKTLKELIQEKGFIESPRAKEIMLQVLDAVGYAHTLGIVHRDLKPSNIMVSDEGKVKILDFGIAKIMGDRGLTRTGAKVGTIYYMSPEQVKGVKDVDNRTDIYSLGIVLYEMLTGNVPFNTATESDFEIMQDIVSGNRFNTTGRTLPVDLAGIVWNMTNPDREQRYATCYLAEMAIRGEGEQNNYAPRFGGYTQPAQPQFVHQQTQPPIDYNNLTPEQAQQLPAATPWRRAAAFAIDAALYSILASFIWAFMILPAYNESEVSSFGAFWDNLFAFINSMDSFIFEVNSWWGWNRLFNLVEGDFWFQIMWLALFILFTQKDLLFGGQGIGKRLLKVRTVLHNENKFKRSVFLFLRQGYKSLLLLPFLIILNSNYVENNEYGNFYGSDQLLSVLYISFALIVIEVVYLFSPQNNGKRLIDKLLPIRVVDLQQENAVIANRNVNQNKVIQDFNSIGIDDLPAAAGVKRILAFALDYAIYFVVLYIIYNNSDNVGIRGVFGALYEFSRWDNIPSDSSFGFFTTVFVQTWDSLTLAFTLLVWDKSNVTAVFFHLAFFILFTMRDVIIDGKGIFKRVFGIQLIYKGENQKAKYFGAFIRNGYLMLLTSIIMMFAYKISDTNFFNFIDGGLYQFIISAAALVILVEIIRSFNSLTEGQRVTDKKFSMKVIDINKKEEMIK